MKNKEKILQDMITKILKKKHSMLTMVSILAGILIFKGSVHALNWMYVDENENPWYRILWHCFYEDTGKIDNIYLGSSHVFCDLDPAALDRLNGQYNFNLATPAQRLNGSYYLLREADRLNELSHVYLELYYECNYDDEKLSDYERNWSNTDYMKPSVNRAAYMLAIGEKEEYVNILFPFSRYRICLGDWNRIKNILNSKKSEDYATYQYGWEYGDGNGKVIFERRGFENSTRKFKDGLKIFYQNEILTDYSIGEINEKYLCGMITYCQEKGIPITLFVSPMYDLQLISTVDYDDYVSAVRVFAEKYDVDFYDFNLAKDAYLPIRNGKYFMDVGHLNQYGAEKFTSFFYQVVSGKKEDNKKYFWDSYEERLRKSEPAVYGIYVESFSDGDESKILQIASNCGTGMEYRITLKPEGKKRRQIQDFRVNMKFQVPVEEHGICTITARIKEKPTKMQTMSIRY